MGFLSGFLKVGFVEKYVNFQFCKGNFLNFQSISGVLCMFAISHKSLSMMNKLTSDSVKEEDFISEAIFDRLSPTRLQKNLNFIAKFPHTTGQKGQSNDNIIKNWIEEQLGDHDKMNFHVEEKTYEVMLSYPTAKNKVSLFNKWSHDFYSLDKVTSL